MYSLIIWKVMQRDINQFIQDCHTCKQHNFQNKPIAQFTGNLTDIPKQNPVTSLATSHHPVPKTTNMF